MSRTDALVIGAGPAGALCALLLARAGAGVTLVERDRFPRHKVCGCCLAPRGQDVLARRAPGVLEGARRIERLEIRRAGDALRTRVPGYRVLSRAQMDDRLVRSARDAGVRVLDRTAARVEADGRVRLTEENAVRDVRPGVVIVADGLGGSSLRGWDAFGWRVRRASRVGVGCVVDRARGVRDDTITMTLARDGYCGVAPLETGAWVIAGALGVEAVRREGAEACVRSWLSGAGIEIGAGRASIKGVPTLTRTRCAVEAEGRVFVVGDGVGYLEPFTGEGMTWALRGAERVSAHALDALSGRYEVGAWARDVRRHLREERAGCRAVTAVLRRPVLSGACVRALTLVGDRVSSRLASAVAHRVLA